MPRSKLAQMGQRPEFADKKDKALKGRHNIVAPLQGFVSFLRFGGRQKQGKEPKPQ